MPDEQHGEEGDDDEKGGIGEQNEVPHMLQQKAGENRGDDLRRHGKSVIEAREFSDVASFTHFHHHGIGIHVDGGPGYAHQSEQAVDPDMIFLHCRADGEHGGQKDDTAQNRLFSPHSGGDGTNRNVGKYGGRRSDQQTVGEAAALNAPVDLCVPGKGCPN